MKLSTVYSVTAESLFLLLQQPAMLFVQSTLRAERAHLVRPKDQTTSSFLLHPPPSFLSSTFSSISFQLVNMCLCVCVRVTNCVCVSACAFTLSAWRGARGREITSWRKHYSIAFSIEITQMFIATSATTGGEGRTFGRLAGLALHGAVVSDALWQQVKRNWLTWECHI